MLAAPITLTTPVARRFHRRAVLLDERVPTIAAALDHLGFVQIDPINVCGRVHDHILRNRVAGYREGDLVRHLHGELSPPPPADRIAFEHHHPESNNLVAFPLEAWPHLLSAMRGRTRRHGAWSGKLTPRERELSEKIFLEIAQRGPLSSEKIDDDRRSRRNIWGSFSLAKSTLQKLFFHGRLLIAGRENNRRLYDLPERVLPPQILAAKEPDAEQTARWLALSKLRQRRLVTLKRDELPYVEDLVQPVKVEGCPTLYMLLADRPVLEEVVALGEAPFEVRHDPQLLAPLDPLIYDRRVTAKLWGFDYTWEVYTPAHKRVRGYYALPILSGLELVGHVDPVADRKKRKLVVVSKRVKRGTKIAPALTELAKFLGVRR